MVDKKNLQNPFPGLRPFQNDEEHLFFGRETQTLELLQLLRDNRFVAVIGTSGSGKSSLVRCGLISELYGGSFLEAGADWEVAVMNPGGGPFSQLSKSLVEADIYDSEEADINLKLNATIRRSRLGLVEAIRQAQLPEGTNFLLVVDQFEEIFRYSETGEEQGEAADGFISMILEATKQTKVPIYVIITMRSDYIGDCSRFEGLPEEINEGEYLIPRLSREEYKSVIGGPVRVGGAKLAPRLLQRLLNDIGTEPDQLPCLQHALMRTWDAWARRSESDDLDLEDYRAIGGMGKALSIHADEIFESFINKDQKATATRMFRAITEKGDDNRGIRRPLALKQLAKITHNTVEELQAVVEPYRQPGVTFLMPPSDRPLDNDTVIDISHESLMRVWQRLRNLVEEEAQSARIYRRLVDTSALWKEGEAGLYHDPDLQISQSWKERYQPNHAWAELYGGGFESATEFLEASADEGRRAEREAEKARQRELQQARELAETRERSAKNMRTFSIAVGCVAIVAVAAMVFAVKQQKIAETAQEDALAAQIVAENAKDTLRKEFINSDINLGLSFSDQGQTGRGLAHFARALEREPNSPAVIDRSFNLLAYNHPPGYKSPELNFSSNQIETSRATADATTLLTAVYHNGEEISQIPNLMVWAPGSETPVHSVHASPGRFQWGNDISIAPDGKTAALALDHLLLLDVETGAIKKITEAKGIKGVRYSTDGKRLLTGTGQQDGNIVQIWDSKTGEIIDSHETKAFFPRWSPDETKILYPRHRMGQTAVYDTKNRSLTTFEHNGTPRITEYGNFDRTGDRIVSMSRDRFINIWDVITGELLYKVAHGPKKQGSFRGTVAVFTPDNQRLLTISDDLAVKLWNAADGELLDSVNISNRHAFMQDPLFSNDGLRVVIPLQNGQAYSGTFDASYSKLPAFDEIQTLHGAHSFLANEGTIKPLLVPSEQIVSGQVTADGSNFFVGRQDGKAALYDLQTGEKASLDIRHFGRIQAVAVSQDRRFAATASSSGTVKTWDLADPTTPLATIGSETTTASASYSKLHFTPDGNGLWVTSHNQALKYNSKTGEILRETQIRPTVSASVSSPDGTLVAITQGSSVSIFDNNAATDAPPVVISGQGRVNAICFSQDNSYIVTGTQTGIVRIWSTLDGQKQDYTINLELAGSTENINTLAVSPDFQQLAVGCESGNLHIFDLPKVSRALAAKRETPEGEIYRSQLLSRSTPEQSVEIDVSIEGAKKLYLVAEDGGDHWQHDVVNWVEPKLVKDTGSIPLTSIEWESATASWGSVQTGQNAAQRAIEVGGKMFEDGIGTHSVSVIEYSLPDGVTRFTALAGIDDKALAFAQGNSLSSVRFAVYTDTAPNLNSLSFKTKTIRNQSPCTAVSFNTSGKMLAAVFTDGQSSYAKVWEAKTGFPVSDELSNSSAVSNVAFQHDGLALITWPDWGTGGSAGIASSWDVAISGGAPGQQQLPDLLKAFGREELDADSKPVASVSINAKIDTVSELTSNSNTAKFFRWLKKFPSQRGDSPFRPQSRPEYIALLRDQNNLILLNEAVRLSPRDAVAIAKRGAYRLTSMATNDPAILTLAESDVVRSLLLEPDNREVLSYASIIKNHLGDTKTSDLLYARASKQPQLSQDQLSALIGLQDTLGASEPLRRKFLNSAVQVAEKNNPEMVAGLTLKRFNLSAENGNYPAAMADWNLIKELEVLPSETDIATLNTVIAKVIEQQAQQLADSGNYEAAIALAKPGAMFSLLSSETKISSLASKLIQWDNRETPPTTIIPAKSHWDYYDKGSDPGENWNQLDFTAEGWSNGLAKLGYGDDGETTVLDYGGYLTEKHPAYYFRHTFEVTEETHKPFLVANIVRDDGVIVYLNGKEVVRDHMPNDVVDYLTFSSGTANPGGPELDQHQFFIDGRLLRLGKNVIAAEIHQTSPSSSDVAFQLELLGSDQDAANYIFDLGTAPGSEALLESAIELMPKTKRESARKALYISLGAVPEEQLATASQEDAHYIVNVAQKIKNDTILLASVDRKVAYLESNPTPANLTERVITLNHKKDYLFTEGASREKIAKVEHAIASPPRTETLPPTCIDLSEYYNASMFHYSGFQGNHENFDLRFLPDRYGEHGGISFDLRGLVQLQSGVYPNGYSLNDFSAVTQHNKSYPTEVIGIEVNLKATKIHFLMGAIFASNMPAGESAASFEMHYEDGTSDEMQIIAKEDIADWFEVDLVSNFDQDKIGWIGTNNLGNARALSKPYWTNPHPEKVVTKIGFISGLIIGAPYLVAITAEP